MKNKKNPYTPRPIGEICPPDAIIEGLKARVTELEDRITGLKADHDRLIERVAAFIKYDYGYTSLAVRVLDHFGTK